MDGKTTSKYQIRDGTFGVALYEAATPADALADYLADRARAQFKGQITAAADGKSASVTVDGTVYSAVS